jgi:hypothetical protein
LLNEKNATYDEVALIGRQSLKYQPEGFVTGSQFYFSFLETAHDPHYT